jgi:diacylglycerol kinase
MGLVWSAEAFNTALEFLADAVSQEPHPLIGQAKDIAAGAVLMAALAAAIVGILLFRPYLLDFLR